MPRYVSSLMAGRLPSFTAASELRDFDPREFTREFDRGRQPDTPGPSALAHLTDVSAGASAAAEVLRANQGADVRVFVIWEPVLLTDWRRPSQSQTSYVPDRRATHFWDLDRRLSADVRRAG